MPALALDDLIAISAAAQLAAYDDPNYSQTASSLLSGLLSGSPYSGWQSLPLLGQTDETGYLPVEVAGSPPVAWSFQDGYYQAAEAAAFAAFDSSSHTLVIAFRGSSEGGDFPWEDFLDAAGNIERQIRLLHTFIERVIAYATDPANQVETVLITGHSLGGELAEVFASIYAPRLCEGDSQLSMGDVHLITYGSVGVPPTVSDIDINGDHVLDNGPFAVPFQASLGTSLHLGNSEDEVYNYAHDELFFLRNGQNIEVFVRDQTGDFSDRGFLEGFTQEHKSLLYYEIWSDISYFHFFQEWWGQTGGQIKALYGLGNPDASNGTSDVFAGIWSGDLVLGLAGSDLITVPIGVAGQTFVAGGSGDDTILGGGGSDYLDGGADADGLSGREGDDFLFGGGGEDNLDGGYGIDTLEGGDGGDTYSVGVGQGYDIIFDNASSANDVLALYTGAYTTLDLRWFTAVGDDLLIRIPQSGGNYALHLLIQGMGTSVGQIETLEFRPGEGWVATATLNLVQDIWSKVATPGPVLFSDAFNRAEGAPGNGWSQLSDSAGGGALLIEDGRLTTNGAPAMMGVCRPLNLEGPITVAATLTHCSGYAGIPYRYVTQFLFGNDGTTTSGFGLQIYRGDINYANSSVILIHNGVNLAVSFSTFQFEESIDVQFTVHDDLSISGVVSDGVNSFSFYFDPVDIQLTGSNFAVIATDAGTGINSTIDNLVISEGTANVTLSGTDAGEVLAGKYGDDTVSGGGGDDTLLGGAGADTLTGGDGDDQVLGEEGDDTLVGGSGAGDDHYDGGDGVDTVRFTSTSLGIVVDLSAGTASGSEIGSDTLNAIENVIGGSGDDTISGNDFSNTLKGGFGNDNLDGSDGDDTIRGGLGDDVLIGGNGFDTLDYADAASGVTIDLRKTTAQATGGAGTDTVSGFEALIGSAFADTIIGTTGANTLSGGNGNDSLNGHNGDDVLNGGNGDDTLIGGAGIDTTTGGSGDDWHYVDNALDVVVETAGGGLADRVLASVSYVLAAGVDIEILTTQTFTGTSAIDLTGNELAQRIEGNAAANVLSGLGGNDSIAGYGGDDTLHGGDGNDVLEGGAGADTTYGGAGNDHHYVNDALDVVVELNGEGNDRILASVSYTVGAGVAVELITTTGGTAAIDLTGNEFSQTLVGNDGSNVLSGGGGDDSMRGNGGIDTTIGGMGDDDHWIDNAGDIVVEGAGEGDNDQVLCLVSYTLGAGVHVELLTTTNYQATLAIDLTGNELAQRIEGNAAANTLSGMGGNDNIAGYNGNDALNGGDGDDVLDGGAGTDTTTGGLGNDLHYVDSASDTVIELAGEGTADRVLASVSYTLAAAAEIELFTTTNSAGTDAINFTGNSFGQRIIGNAASNTLNGMDGNDELRGLDGDDILIGGAGNDLMLGGNGADVFLFNAGLFGNDTVTDFADGTDHIQFSGIAGVDDFSDLAISANGSGYAVITLPDGSTITLNNITTGQVDASDFVFGP